MAEYVAVDERYLLTFPSTVAPELAALAEPLSVAVHAVIGRAEVSVGHKVVVSGPGPIGLFCSVVAKSAGGQVLLTGVGSDGQTRLPVAAELGLPTADLEQRDLTSALEEEWSGLQPDVWIEASGSPAAAEAALKAVRPGGAVVLVGMTPTSVSFTTAELLRSELTVRFSYASTRADYQVALTLLEANTLDRSIVSTFALPDVADAFEATRTGQAVKSVVLPHSDLDGG